MRKIKEASRLYLKMGLSIRAIARACNISASTAHEYVKKLKEQKISYEEISAFEEDELHKLLFPEPCRRSIKRGKLDYGYLEKEMSKKGVTLQLLYEEYEEVNPEGYGRSQFYKHYRDYIRKTKTTMRFNHKAGEKMWEDFSGDKPHYIDGKTGNVIETELFVSAVGVSSYTYACAVPNQKVENLVKSNIKAFEHYGGCCECIIIDNLKSGVTHACYYDPEINKTFAEMAQHYNVAVLPARVKKPKDKAKVESAVLQAQRRILAKLRNRTFFSIGELNEAIYEETENLNNRPMANTGKSRHELFQEIDKPALKELPAERFTVCSWKKAKVHIDYHVELDKSYYSVSYTLIGQYVEIKYDWSVVRIYHKGKQVASHIRAYEKGVFVTDKNHMPNEHRNYLEWTPARIKNWGEKIGENTKIMMKSIMEIKRHPEHGFRGCLGIIRMAKTYSPERVENACKIALSVKAYSYRSIKSILAKKLDTVNVVEDNGRTGKAIEHRNIRGGDYYKNAGNDL